MNQPRQNKALHPTASVPLVPRFTPAAGELGRSTAARGLGASVIIKIAMTRDNEHKTYKQKWACFSCRKCFKQRSLSDLLRARGFAGGKAHLIKRVILCPQCRRQMVNMGWDFKVPKQKDVEQWKKVELLSRNGYDFHSLCWWGEPHKGPGPRPSRLRDVEPFEQQRKATEK